MLLRNHEVKCLTPGFKLKTLFERQRGRKKTVFPSSWFTCPTSTMARAKPALKPRAAPASRRCVGSQLEARGSSNHTQFLWWEVQAAQHEAGHLMPNFKSELPTLA